MLNPLAIILSPFLIVVLSIGIYYAICLLRNNLTNGESLHPRAVINLIITEILPMLLFTAIFTVSYYLLPINKQLLPFGALYFFAICANVDILSGFLPFELTGLLLLQFFIARGIFQYNLPLFGFAISVGCMLSIYLLGKKFFPADPTPFGLGDVWFGSVIGLYFGFPIGLKMIAAGLIINGFFALILRLLLKNRIKSLPLIPGFVLAILAISAGNFV